MNRLLPLRACFSLLLLSRLPDDGWAARGDGDRAGPLDGPWQSLGMVRHSFTHFDLDLQLMFYSCGDLDRLRAEGGDWWQLDRIDEAGLPTLFAKAARLALAQQEDLGE